MNYRIILDAPFKKEVKRLAKKYPSLKRDLEALALTLGFTACTQDDTPEVLEQKE